MARFATILGEGQGTLGNYYLRKAKSSTGKTINVMGIKNFSPTNPRTTAQQSQRAKFATAVKFFRRATKNFFQFAYEDKKANESYFNAFMRHNVNRALGMVKVQNDSIYFPALGNSWMLAQGSLGILDINLDFDDKFVTIGDSDDTISIPSSGLTVGALSTYVENYNKGADLQEGDIITLVMVRGGLARPLLSQRTVSAIEDGVTYGYTFSPSWEIGQFIFNKNSEVLVSSLDYVGTSNPLEGLEVYDGNYIGFSPASMEDTDGTEALTYAAYGIIRTRKTDSGLEAGNAYLLAGPGLQEVLAAAVEDDYLADVLSSWKAASEAILAGKIAAGTVANSVAGVVTSVNDGSVGQVISLSANSTSTSLALVGTNLNKVTVADFKLSNTVASFTSYTAASATSATLVIGQLDETGATPVSVYLGNQLLATISLSDGDEISGGA